jgi:hypothetical protein
MANLEDEAKPILLTLIRGETRVLDESEQVALTRWALKTAMVLEFSHPKGLAIPPTDRHKLREGALPEHAQVWVALYNGTNNTLYYHDQHRVPTPDKSGALLAYAVTLAVGHVLFHIWVPATAGRRVENLGALSVMLHQIHPDRSSVTVGPDGLDGEGVAWVVASQRNPIPAD